MFDGHFDIAALKDDNAAEATAESGGGATEVEQQAEAAALKIKEEGGDEPAQKLAAQKVREAAAAKANEGKDDIAKLAEAAALKIKEEGGDEPAQKLAAQKVRDDAAAKANEGKDDLVKLSEAAALKVKEAGGDEAAQQAASKKVLDDAAEEKRGIEAEKKATAKLLKDLGVKTLAEAMEKLKAPESKEDLEKKAIQFKAAVDSYAVTKEYMKREDIIALENMKTAEPATIAYGEFEKNYKEKVKDATPEQVRQQFNLFYHIESTDPLLKEKGEEQIKGIAASIIAEKQAKYDKAESDFKEENSQKARVPEFKAVVQSVIKDSIPAKLTLFKDGDKDPITFDITPADLLEAEKFLVNNEAFADFLEKGDGQPIRDSLKDRAIGYLWLKNKDTMLQATYQAGVSAGTAQGSTTGAEAAFKIKQQAETALQVEADLTDAEKDKLKRTLG